MPTPDAWGGGEHLGLGCGGRALAVLGCGRGLTWGGVGWWAGWVAGLADFVGRAGELPRLHAALGGDTRVLLVVGDAGVGKTRFVREGLRQAAGDGVVAVWGGCLPLAEQLPLLPVAGALGELAAVDGGQRRRWGRPRGMCAGR
jgi:AAA ATPase domain